LYKIGEEVYYLHCFRCKITNITRNEKLGYYIYMLEDMKDKHKIIAHEHDISKIN
jgi:hypothetical protein